MGIVTRKMQHRKVLVFREFKNPLRKVANVMAIGFTDDDYYRYFKKLYPELMDKAAEMCEDYQRHNRARKKKGYKTTYFPKPDELLKRLSINALKKIRERHKQGLSISLDELLRNREALEASCIARAQRYMEKKENYLKHAQSTSPKYIDTLIDIYFNNRKTNTLDVNTRYLILLEIAQFYCEKTLSFISKISACDKNSELKDIAYDLLQQMGRHPWLERNRKGKKKQSMLKRIDIAKNPTSLLDYIHKYQTKLHTRYDVFLSHSSFDVDKLLLVKQLLNNQDKVVYVDWVNDSVMMNRASQNDDTWNVLVKRMDESSELLFVMTDNSLRSLWTKREVDYFKESGKPISVLITDDHQTEKQWDVLEGLPKYRIIDNNLIKS